MVKARLDGRCARRVDGRFAPGDEMAFNAMLVRLRASEEWHYVEREIDIRLERVV